MRLSYDAKLVFNLDKDIPVSDADRYIIKYLESKGIEAAFDLSHNFSFVVNFYEQVKKTNLEARLLGLQIPE